MPAATALSRLRDVEPRLPTPIAAAVKRYRDLGADSGTARAALGIKVAEVTIKYLAALAARYSLAAGEPTGELRDALRGFGQSALGNWAQLLGAALPDRAEGLPEPLAGLVRWYRGLGGGRDPELEPVVSRLAQVSRLSPPPRAVAGVQAVAVLVQVRNRFAHDGAVSESESREIALALDAVLVQVLDGIADVGAWRVAFVERVEVRSGEMVHSVRIGRGRDFEKDEVVAPQPLDRGRLYVFGLANDGAVERAIDLSPYVLFRDCSVCRRSEVFFFQRVGRRNVDYVSYGCGHELSIDDPSGEFRNIEEFLAGRITHGALLEGKVIGFERPGDGRRVTREARRHAHRLLVQARQGLVNGQPEAATEAANAALEADPDAGEAHYLLGLCALVVGADARATLATLEEAVRLAPGLAEAWYALGRVAAVVGNGERARSAVAQALSLNPAHGSWREFAQALDAGQPQPRSEGGEFQTGAVLVAELLGDAAGAGLPELRLWVAALPPWRWLAPQPTLRTLALCGGLTAMAMFASFDSLDLLRILWLLVVGSLCFLGFWVPLIVPRAMDQLFRELQAAVLLPRDSFRRWILSELVPYFGSFHLLSAGESYDLGNASRRDRFLVAATVGWFALFLPFHVACAWGMDPWAPELGKIVRYGLYTVEVWALAWIPAFVWRSLLFIPGFTRLPIRHFAGAPDAVSLKPLGTYYLAVGSLAMACEILVTTQHYLFRTHETVTYWSFGFQGLSLLMVTSFVFASQVLILREMERRRSQRLVEFSFHVESAFDQFLRDPAPPAWAALQERQLQARHLQRALRFGGLSGWGKWWFLGLSLLQVAAVVVYAGLIHSGLLVPGGVLE